MSFDKDTVFKKLQGVFNTVFSIPENDVNMETSLANTQAWDSLQHMVLVLKIEQEFNIKFEMGEIIELNSIEKILETLEGKDINL